MENQAYQTYHNYELCGNNQKENFRNYIAIAKSSINFDPINNSDGVLKPYAISIVWAIQTIINYYSIINPTGAFIFLVMDFKSTKNFAISKYFFSGQFST